MADWIYAPAYDSRWAEPLPPTLKTNLDDGKSIRRQKHTNTVSTWRETYDFTKAEHDAAHTFFQAHYGITSFTKLSYDIGGTPTQERTVYFDGPWDVQRAGDDWFKVSLDFELFR